MADKPISITEALKDYDRKANSEAIDIAEKERKEIVERFPLDNWPTMPLERYALGLGDNENSYCWWLEWGTHHVGSMRGGSARKHIIYRHNDGNWYYDKQRFKNEQEAWQALRTSFVEAFTEAKSGTWDKVDHTDGLPLGPAQSAKSLYCYFPDQLLPIASTAHIRHFLDRLGHKAAETNDLGVIQLNRTLLESLRERAEFKTWTTKELERFLYHWADPRDQRRIVKIAPGGNAKYWPECLAGGYIKVGWGEAGDLRDFESREAYRVSFGKRYGGEYNNHQPIITKKSKEVWTLRELEVGDLVAANQGTSKILAVGEVVEPGYEWVKDAKDFNNIVHVKWDTSFEQDIPPQKSWAMLTVADIPQTLASQILTKQVVHNGSGNTTKPKPPLVIDPLFQEIADALDRKGQAVLYGPPGTGKTYAARRFAIWWLLRQSKHESPELVLSDPVAFGEAEQKMATSQVTPRVWWVVANPKEWDWEQLFKNKRVEYRYGRLQRNYPLVRKGDLVVGYQSSPDKKIVALAKIARELYTAKDGDPTIDLEPLARVEDGLSYEELQKDKVLAESEPMRFRCQGTLFGLTEDEFDHLAAALIERNPEVRHALQGKTGGIGPLTRLTFHPSYSYEDFIEGFRPVDTKGSNLTLRLEDGVFKRICREAQANPTKPYLVLIDEINRANVAKVFGELITLLEKDKRGMLINLPQSKESFTIPPNVYVLGTMNTADRSIKLLDAALRRRFSFIELMPDSSLLEGGKVGNLHLAEFLDEINRRIAAKEGREKQIGHSFLLDGSIPVTDPDEFARRFRQEILPLLQEYCYEDYSLLAEYIGEKLVNKDAQTLNEDRLADPDQLIAALEAEFMEKEPE